MPLFRTQGCTALGLVDGTPSALAFVMASARAPSLSTVLACGLGLLACSDAPRIRLEPATAQAGQSLVVRFDEPVPKAAARTRWLTLVPAGSPENDARERVLLEDGATEALVPTTAAGLYELRLLDEGPLRPRRLVSRLLVEVRERPIGKSTAPIWYW